MNRETAIQLIENIIQENRNDKDISELIYDEVIKKLKEKGVVESCLTREQVIYIMKNYDKLKEGVKNE